MIIVLIPWVLQVDLHDPLLALLATVSGAIWWAVLLWAFHHLAFQLGALFIENPVAERQTGTGQNDDAERRLRRPHVALLYTTCDDFIEESCLSCLKQTYEPLRVLVCDDSAVPERQAQVERFCSDHSPRCTLIKRSSRDGFKAGNVNNAITTHAKDDEWILLVDADQELPSDYLSKLVAKISDDENVAFIQGSNEALINGTSSPFQESLSFEVSLFYTRDLPLRESFGFLPLLGHGALIRRSSWEEVGGFPERVSEDFAFALRVGARQQHGTYVKDVVAYEAFPYDFGGFMVRLRKFAGGTAELIRTEAAPFFRSRASPVEKWDFFLQLSWYGLMPLVILNGFLGAYVVHRIWNAAELRYIYPILPYLYAALLVGIFAVSLSLTRATLVKTIKFYFWSTAIYSAAMPVASVAFIRHFFFQPTFVPTPKGQHSEPVGTVEAVALPGLGIVAITLAIVWWSPFTPFLVGQGVAYLSYPLYCQLCRDSRVGRLARIVIFAPGLLMLSALVAMWLWGR